MWPALNQIKEFLNFGLMSLAEINSYFVAIFSTKRNNNSYLRHHRVNYESSRMKKKTWNFTWCSIVHPLAICISRCYKSQLLSKSKKWYELTRCCGGAGHNCFMLWFRAHHSVVGQQTKAFEVLCQRNDMKSPDAVALPAIIVLEEESASCICFPAANWQSWNKCSSLLFLFSSWGY